MKGNPSWSEKQYDEQSLQCIDVDNLAMRVSLRICGRAAQQKQCAINALNEAPFAKKDGNQYV